MLFARKISTGRHTACHAASRDNSPKNHIVAARKLFESKRLVSLKENVNKLILIATADTKEISDFVKELDELHKKELNYNKKKSDEEDEDDDDTEDNNEDADDDKDASDSKDSVLKNDPKN